MVDSESQDRSPEATLSRCRTGVHTVGAICVAIALAQSILIPSVLRNCEGVIAVRLSFLDGAGAIDYGAARAAGEDGIRELMSLTKWVVGDGLGAAYVAAYATTVVFAVLGVACLALAWRYGPSRGNLPRPTGTAQE